MRGYDMFLRMAVVLGFGLVSAGCIHETGPMALGMPKKIGTEKTLPNPQPSFEDDALATPNMASKVLTAIALERVTGRIPDPASFGKAF